MINDNKEKRASLLPIFMCIGVGLGGLVGYLAFNQIAIGMCFGVSLGLFASVIFDKKEE